jgi:hypothetical protein
MQNVNNVEQQIKHSGLNTLNGLLASSTSLSVNKTVSDAWKNRTFTDSVDIPSDYTKPVTSAHLNFKHILFLLFQKKSIKSICNGNQNQ